MTTRVFVSYRRDDSKHAAGRLGERLDERFEVFTDVDQIQAGDLFPAVIRKAVEEADVFLAVIGPHWLSLPAGNGGRRIDQADDWVAEEIGTALRQGTPVIPVLVDGAPMPGRGELPPALADLANRHAMRIAHESFGVDSARLIEAIQRLASPAAQPRKAQTASPRRGALPLDTEGRPKGIPGWAVVVLGLLSVVAGIIYLVSVVFNF
jgi:hypothetical protein